MLRMLARRLNQSLEGHKGFVKPAWKDTCDEHKLLDTFPFLVGFHYSTGNEIYLILLFSFSSKDNYV